MSASPPPASEIPAGEHLPKPQSSGQDANGRRERPWRLGFWSLIVTQFQGAFNDNALKFLVIYLVVSMNLAPGKRDFLVLVVGGLFALPFLLFSMTGGYFADRYSKRTVTIGTKFFEIGVMFFALSALATANLPMELAAVFLISTQGALFGPSKYGLLPELLPEKRLSWGNGVLELGTFLGAIVATAAAGNLADAFTGRQVWSGVILLGCTAVGTCTSFGISRVPAAKPDKEFRYNPAGDLGAQLRVIRRDRVLGWAVLGNTYFWYIAALLQFTIVIYGHDVLHASDRSIGYYLQGAIAIGIGLGSLAAGYLSGGKIEYGLIPIGAVGMTVFGFLMAQHGLGFSAVAVYLALLGFSGGFFAVPLNALIQHRPHPDEKGSVIAAANLLSFVGVFTAAGVYYGLSAGLKLSPGGIFLAGAVMTLVTSAYAMWLLPDALLRFVLWVLTHTIYSIRVDGRDNIPERGGALFVCNHMSFVDACLLIASTDRPIRFVMFKDIYEHPLIYPFAKTLKCIPISSQLRPREMIHSLRTASEAIRNGEVVCIFAEGQITRIGHLLPFRRGFERIMRNVDAPIVPVNLDGVWGSIFSFDKGRFFWKFPRRIPYPVTVSFGKPMPPTASAFEVRQAVQDLHAEAYRYRKARMRTLPAALVNTARRHPWRYAMGDARVPRVSWGGVLPKALYLAGRLKEEWDGQNMVGILLPPSVGAALVNFAATLCGKVPVNLNYTASSEIIASCAKQCGIETVVTSRAFLERVPVEVPGRPLLLEDIAAKPGIGEKLKALWMAWLVPTEDLQEKLGVKTPPKLDDLATVIFSSGSTGDPKGVMLSHYNIGSNIEQVGQTFMLDRHDRLLGVLPFFHSFGYTVTLWLPAVLGIGVVYHPNPLDLTAIRKLVPDYKVTFLLATPTFLQAYTRRCQPEEFGGVQYVMTGAEKLPERVALAFEDRFGLRPLEGYGCTECSPVVSVNTPDFRAAGFRQIGAKRGRIGHPLPGVTVRIADAETMEPVEPGKSGMLLVRGPNVMQGYLGKPEKTAEVLRDGWYVTGDVAAMDEDGFITITDRLSRFSKIGGEMVPHIKVEEKLHELAGATEQTFVVTGVPDTKKGERLVVLHKLPDDKLKEVIEKLGKAGLPNLWVPKTNQFYRVESFPMLGTGKLDLRKVREVSEEKSQKSPQVTQET